MIRGNTMDTFTIHFDDGESFSLMAVTHTGAQWLAAELCPGKKIMRVERIGEWDEGDK
jgi:hypothetical protein